MYKNSEMGMKGTYVASLTVILAFSLSILPVSLVGLLPVIVQYILGSSIASDALVASILNKLLPKM